MVVVPEWGTKTKRPHLQFAIGRYVPKDVLERLWGLGYVDIRARRPTPNGERMGAREQARRAAAYVSKYVTKSYTESGLPEDRGDGVLVGRP